MLSDPSKKYLPFAPVKLADRRWPSRQLVAPPIWCSTDLRDGNQALFEPMSCETKKELFAALVAVGLKEIEIGFPSASETDFATARMLIEENLIPEDVTPMVLTQAREELIERTVASLAGARRAIIHVYNATAPAWRRIVFNMSVPEVIQLVEHHVRFIKKLTDKLPQTEWILQYSPETFSMTELEVSLQACHAAMQAWETSSARRIILNLPSTVENATPNHFADQVEWMHRQLTPREHAIISVHCHNDRGTGIAAAELAQLAGAERVEGCLFGNGERCGNVDLTTLALNLYTQGIAPGLDFSNINSIARVVEACTKLPIHPRHPYVGDLVFTAFSGSHQDAIKKGMAFQQHHAVWQVPYLPIDPADVGRTYDSVIRINSQSGKGGIAYLLERDYGVVMPRRMQVEFSALVQAKVDVAETEMHAQQLWELFCDTYFKTDDAIDYHRHTVLENGTAQVIELEITRKSQRQILRGTGNGPIDATVNALGLPLRIDSYEERSLGHGANAAALAIIEASGGTPTRSCFGAGRHPNITTASILAILSAVRRLSI
jgi:2-isopropylmalate synthase